VAYVFYENEGHGAGADVTRREKAEAILKIFALFGVLVAFISFLVVRKISGPGAVAKTTVKSSFGAIEYVTPYKNVLYENFGFVNEPKLLLPLKTINGYVETVFLLDSGAVVSALPLQAAHDTGVDLAKAKRITLQGFSGVAAFAYLDDIAVQIAGKDFVFPAVFTESNKTTYILGRKGFFDDFDIVFDHEARTVTLRTK